MTKCERHPAPEKLLLQVTTEAVNLLALGTPANPGDASLPEAGIALIAKAWGLPEADLEASLHLIQRQKRLSLAGSREAALPDEQLLEPYDGVMIAGLIWGLFETAVRLDDIDERRTIHRLALQIADTLGFDEWLGQAVGK